MNKLEKLTIIREKLKNNLPTLGTWMQIPNASIAEILGKSNYDWVAIDLEHGSFSLENLPNIFRSLELGNTLPLVRLQKGTDFECKSVLDAGAAGVIIPMVESADQLRSIISFCKWPPEGIRGVGFSRANLFGRNFNEYVKEAHNPLIIAMIENIKALDELDRIIDENGLDAIFIGPYDLSASMGLTTDFKNIKFINTINKILDTCTKKNIPYGIHVVMPDPNELNLRIKENYQFIAYSIDAFFLNSVCQNPIT